MAFGISALGGYVPLLRLDRRMAARELAWSGLGMPRAGQRAVAGWDEDPLTMAVEAARRLCHPDALCPDAPASGAPDSNAPDADAYRPDALRFASTSAYFTDRAQSAIALDALGLPRSVRTSDSANSRRAATAALLDALLSGRNELVIAGEKRPTRPGSASHLAFGDGGAAVRVGPDGAARLAGFSSRTHDLVDRYSSQEHRFSYAYEERFVRDVAVGELLVPTAREACAAAGIEPSRLAQVACAEPVAGAWRAAAGVLGCKAVNHCELLAARAGDLGAAQAPYGLGLALAAASPGDFVLLLGFGSGADALVFEVLAPVPGAQAMADQLERGLLLENYARFLSLSGAIELDWGMRSEFAQKAQATVLERVGRDMIGFVGGRDSLGNVQFPKSPIPVNPGLQQPEELQDVRLAECEATIVSATADRLNYTPDPPFDFGLVQFDNGARVLMEMTDRPDGGFHAGERVRMRLRIKAENRQLGFRTYFWKAAPLLRPSLGEA